MIYNKQANKQKYVCSLAGTGLNLLKCVWYFIELFLPWSWSVSLVWLLREPQASTYLKLLSTESTDGVTTQSFFFFISTGDWT